MFERWRQRRRRRLELEEERLMRMEAMREAYRDRTATGTISGVAESLGKALDRTFQIEAKLLDQMGGFIGVLEEASAKRAAQVLGSRGGFKRQEQLRNKRLPKPPACPLCQNPQRRDVTWSMVEEHRKHQHISEPPPNTNGAAA